MQQQIIANLISLVILFTLLFLFIKLAGPLPLSINSVTTTKSDSFQVSGEGTVEVTPNLTTLSVGVQSQGSTVKSTQELLNQNINQVSEAIKALGVDSKDIQTQNYNINPQYDYRSGTQRVSGYSANTNLNIKVRDLDQINSVIDAATKAGATNIGGLDFEVADRTQAENEARVKAVAEAKTKAENAAKVAGFTLGKLINYSESFDGGVTPFKLGALSLDAQQTTPTDIEPGTSEIRVVVTLSYEVK